MNINALKHFIRQINNNSFLILLFKILKFLHIRYIVTRIDTNHLCNLSCKMCYFNSKTEQRKCEMDLSLYNKVAKEIFPKTRVLFLSCFAEPFCSKNIIEFIKIAKYTYKIPFVSLTTNGLLVNRLTAEKLVRSGLDEIVFSIAGGQKDTYEYIQKGALWETFWENVSNLHDCRKMFSSTKPGFQINYILNRKSVFEVKNIIPFLVRNDINSVNMRELIPFRDIDKSFYDQYRLHEDDDQLVKQAFDDFNRHGIKTIDSIQCSRNDKLSSSRKYPCIQPYFSFFIDQSAHIKFCLFQEWKHSLEKNTISEILKNESHMRFLDSLKDISTAHCVADCPFHSNGKNQI